MLDFQSCDIFNPCLEKITKKKQSKTTTTTTTTPKTAKNKTNNY